MTPIKVAAPAPRPTSSSALMPLCPPRPPIGPRNASSECTRKIVFKGFSSPEDSSLEGEQSKRHILEAFLIPSTDFNLMFTMRCRKRNYGPHLMLEQMSLFSRKRISLRGTSLQNRQQLKGADDSEKYYRLWPIAARQLEHIATDFAGRFRSLLPARKHLC